MTDLPDAEAWREPLKQWQETWKSTSDIPGPTKSFLAGFAAASVSWAEQLDTANTAETQSELPTFQAGPDAMRVIGPNGEVWVRVRQEELAEVWVECCKAFAWCLDQDKNGEHALTYVMKNNPHHVPGRFGVRCGAPNTTGNGSTELPHSWKDSRHDRPTV